MFFFGHTVTHYHRYLSDYLFFTSLDDVFNVLFFFFTIFGWFSWFPLGILWFFMISGWFSWFLMYFHGLSFFKFSMGNDAIFLQNHQGWCSCNFFEARWLSYAIISNSRQPSVQQCGVCDVLLKSRFNWRIILEIWVTTCVLVRFPNPLPGGLKSGGEPSVPSVQIKQFSCSHVSGPSQNKGVNKTG